MPYRDLTYHGFILPCEVEEIGLEGCIYHVDIAVGTRYYPE